MIIKQVALNTNLEDESILTILFAQDDGVESSIQRLAPEGWSGMDQPSKLSWVQSEVASHLGSTNYADPFVLEYPDRTAKMDAISDFGNLPGWASWSGQDAEDWINANVTDLASAKVALVSMARAIVYLRDIVIDR